MIDSVQASHRGRVMRHEITTRASADQVWSAWTQMEKLQQWFPDRAEGRAVPPPHTLALAGSQRFPGGRACVHDLIVRVNQRSKMLRGQLSLAVPKKRAWSMICRNLS